MFEEQGLAVIRGASSGIGAVYAERLAARGHSLLLVARRPDRLANTRDRLSSNYRVEVAVLVADLERPSDLSDLWGPRGSGRRDLRARAGSAGVKIKPLINSSESFN